MDGLRPQDLTAVLPHEQVPHRGRMPAPTTRCPNTSRIQRLSYPEIGADTGQLDFTDDGQDIGRILCRLHRCLVTTPSGLIPTFGTLGFELR